MKFSIAIEPGTAVTARGVVVPDLPGCFSAGDTAKEAFANAVEAIDAHCEMLTKDGVDIPLPRPLSEHLDNPEFAGWTWGMVEVPVERYMGRAMPAFAGMTEQSAGHPC